MKKMALWICLAGVLLISACGITKKDLGFARQGPDEKNVKTNAPLILPPEYSVRPKSSITDKYNEDSILDD